MVHGIFSCFRKHRSTSALSKSAPAPPSSLDDKREEVEMPEGPGPVLVELFSSQGCVTSPAAELLVSRLGRGDFHLDFPVIILAFHVDYWDYKGWKDPFGSTASTVRQKAYVETFGLDTMFTPLVVVQGRAHCTANDEDALLSAIRGAPLFPAPAFQAAFQRPSPETLQVTISGALRSKVDGSANIVVALYESGLVINCPSGDNQGKVLSNDFVVRKFEILRDIDNVSVQKSLSETAKFALWEGFKSTKCGVAVFVQNGSHQIFGSQNFRLPENL